MKLKRCSRCKKEFPATSDYFYRYKSNPDGLCYICKECHKKATRKYREENMEKIREYDKKYREENMEKTRERQRKYREENMEKIREYYKKYREENRKEYQKNFMTLESTGAYVSRDTLRYSFKNYQVIAYRHTMNKHLGRILKTSEQVHHKMNPETGKVYMEVAKKPDGTIMKDKNGEPVMVKWYSTPEHLEVRPHNGDDHIKMVITRLENKVKKLEEENRRLKKRNLKIDFTTIKKGGVSVDELIERL
jgi:hypothetical protein